MKLVRNIFFTLILLFFFTSLTKNLFEYFNNLSFYESTKNEYQKQQKKNTTLKTQILKNRDPNEVEKTIRNELNLLKPDEIAVIIPSPTPTPYIPTPTIAPTYKQWISVFLKN